MSAYLLLGSCFAVSWGLAQTDRKLNHSHRQSSGGGAVMAEAHMRIRNPEMVSACDTLITETGHYLAA